MAQEEVVFVFLFTDFIVFCFLFCLLFLMECFVGLFSYSGINAAYKEGVSYFFNRKRYFSTPLVHFKLL